MKRTTKVLFARELFSFWISPAPYLALLGLLSAGCYFLYGYVTSYTERMAQHQAGFLSGGEFPNYFHWIVEPYFETVGFFLVFLIPILIGRSGREGGENGDSDVLRVAPVRPGQIVLARFFSFFLSVSGILLLITVPIGMLTATAHLPLLPLLTGLLGLFAVSGLYIGIGLVVSELIRSSVASALLHLSLLFVLYFLHAVEGASLFQFSLFGFSFSLPSLFSPVLHGSRIMEGLLSLSDFTFFMSFTAGALFVATRLVQREYER